MWAGFFSVPAVFFWPFSMIDHNSRKRKSAGREEGQKKATFRAFFFDSSAVCRQCGSRRSFCWSGSFFDLSAKAFFWPFLCGRTSDSSSNYWLLCVPSVVFHLRGALMVIKHLSDRCVFVFLHLFASSVFGRFMWIHRGFRCMEGQTLRIVATCIEEGQDAQSLCSLQPWCHWIYWKSFHMGRAFESFCLIVVSKSDPSIYIYRLRDVVRYFMFLWRLVWGRFSKTVLRRNSQASLCNSNGGYLFVYLLLFLGISRWIEWQWPHWKVKCRNARVIVIQSHWVFQWIKWQWQVIVI